MNIGLDYKNIKDKNLQDNLDGKVVMAFITINTGSVKDWKIFLSWSADFYKKKVPFVITEHTKERSDNTIDTYRSLWVEEIAPPVINRANIRIKTIFDINKCI